MHEKTDPKRHTQSAFHDDQKKSRHDAPCLATQDHFEDPDQSDFFSTNMGHKRSLQEIMRPESARPRAAAARIPDAMDFVRDSVEMLADRGAWAGGGAMVGEME